MEAEDKKALSKHVDEDCIEVYFDGSVQIAMGYMEFDLGSVATEHQSGSPDQSVWRLYLRHRSLQSVRVRPRAYISGCIPAHLLSLLAEQHWPTGS